MQIHKQRLIVRTSPEVPRYILIGIQKDKFGGQDKNPAIFDHVNVTKMSVVMNDTEYPAVDMNANFTKNQYTHFYKMLSDFSREFYGIDPLVRGNAITPLAYKELFLCTYSTSRSRVNAYKKLL